MLLRTLWDWKDGIIYHRGPEGNASNAQRLESDITRLSGTGTVTFKNTASGGGSNVSLTSVNVSGGSLGSGYLFSAVAGPDTCTGKMLTPGQTCTVGVRFTNVFAARGVNRAGTIQFTDNGQGSPQSGSLVGFATP